MAIEIVKADYNNDKHRADIPALLNAYATDPMGGGQPLREEVKANLVNELAKLPHAFSVLAYVDGKAAGLCQLMLNKVEEIALAKGCCKVTLEVLSNNIVAKSAYLKFGFAGYELDPKAGSALFWQKTLSSKK